MARQRALTHKTPTGRRGQRRSLPPLLVFALAIALLLISAPSAVGFGFITKWSNTARHEKRVKPVGVATDRAGHVYVVGDYQNVQKFTSRGALIAEWVGREKARGISSGVATDRAGNVYVTKIQAPGGHGLLATHYVEKFTPKGRLVTQWRVRGADLGSEPTSVATDRAGNVYVAVKTSIEKFTSNGRFLTQWTNSVPGVGFDATIRGIATDAIGNVYVAGGARITKFTSEGGFVLAWGKDVGGPGVDVCTVACVPARQVGRGASMEPGAFSFSGGAGIVIDGADHVFVSDGYEHRVQEFGSTGTYLDQFGVFGGGNGQFRAPEGLATDARGDLYVVDHNNFRIQKFGEPSSAFSFDKSVRTDPRTGTAQVTVEVPGVGRLSVGGAQLKSASRTAKGAGELVLPVNPTDETRKRLEASGRAAVRMQVTYTPTTPGTAVPATKSKRVTLIQLPSLTTATFDGASLLVRVQCPAGFEPLCVGRTMAVTARDRCERREGRRICHRGAPMTTSASVRQKPTESKVVQLKVKSGFRRKVAQLARHPGAKSLLIRQLIHAKGFRHGRPQAVFHTYKVQAEK